MQSETGKTKVVIAGGGTAGWLTAAALAQQMGAALDITLVESAEIGTIGVGEATIPPMRTFHRLLRIDEQEFMRVTNATFKLGIEFENWKTINHKYFHSFGRTGRETLITDFIHFWLKGRKLGIAEDFGAYCVELSAASQGQFAVQVGERVNYAFHLDAGRYAGLLRTMAESGGVKRLEGKIREVRQDSVSGNITSLVMDSDTVIPGDLFIDCTGMRGLLIEQTLNTGFEDWNHWLPCDRAVAVQTESTEPARPYTRSIAHRGGWRWKIPLQNRTGNGIVFCSRYMSEDEATSQLLSEIDGKTIIEPRTIPFRVGKRRKVWNKNCIAIGLSSGFLEPLESTSIHLIMTAITRLLQMFPHKEIRPSVVDEYNRQAIAEVEGIRDFIILHYKITERDDSQFWRYCRNMDIPEELAHRIRLFKDAGKFYQRENELFRLDSWTQVLLGQGILPESYHPIVDTMSKDELQRLLVGLRDKVKHSLKQMPTHEEFVRAYCAAAS